jgi:RNA recognition motif-containing protein
MEDPTSLLVVSPTIDVILGAEHAEPKSQLPPSIEPKDDRLLFVGGVSCKKKSLMRLFSQFGLVEKIWAKSVPSDNGKLLIKDIWARQKVGHRQLIGGCCFVLLKESQAAQQAISLNGTEFKGNTLRVDWACGSLARDYKRCVFVRNLPYDVTDDELRAEFSEVGEVEYLQVIRDPETSIGKGTAFVCFESKRTADLALKKQGRLFKVNARQGRKLKVIKAREETEYIPEERLNPFINPGSLRTQQAILVEPVLGVKRGRSAAKEKQREKDQIKARRAKRSVVNAKISMRKKSKKRS